MQIQKNISLKNYNTFQIDECAKELFIITSEEELMEVTEYGKSKNEPINIIGGGSNILLTKTLDAVTILNQISGKHVVSENDDDIHIQFQSGENWHECVQWCVSNNYGGIENLSLIPGTIGAAPIQNIGAYGVEIKDVFVKCEAVDILTGEKKIFTHEECHFGYRDSIFKTSAKGQYFILSVTLRLSKKNHQLKLDYGNIKEELKNMEISEPNIAAISKAVIQIRESKLPNPKVIGNAGSFFKNPVIQESQFQNIQEKHLDIPHYITNLGIKIPAAWLIEKAGWKGLKKENYGVHDKQALVLVNFGNAKGKDILQLSDNIITSVQQVFNISLEREVNLW